MRRSNPQACVRQIGFGSAVTATGTFLQAFPVMDEDIAARCANEPIAFQCVSVLAVESLIGCTFLPNGKRGRANLAEVTVQNGNIRA